MLERTLADSERVRGPDHPETLTSRNDLTAAYQYAGRTAEAIPLLERTLADCERVLGPDHPKHSGFPQQPGQRLPGPRTGLPRLKLYKFVEPGRPGSSLRFS
jgi:Tetratricopeptide repeat